MDVRNPAPQSNSIRLIMDVRNPIPFRESAIRLIMDVRNPGGSLGDTAPTGLLYTG